MVTMSSKKLMIFNGQSIKIVKPTQLNQFVYTQQYIDHCGNPNIKNTDVKITAYRVY